MEIVFFIFIFILVIIAIVALSGGIRGENELGDAKTIKNLGELDGETGGDEKPILLGIDSTGQEIFYTGEKHLLAFGSTRSGKGVGALIPNAVKYSGPMLIFDPKNEAQPVVEELAPHKQMFVCAPLSENPGNLSIDLLAIVRKARDINAAISSVCELIVVPSTHATQIFFENEARSLLKGVLLVYAARADGSLSQVVELITCERDKLRAKLTEFANDPTVSPEAVVQIHRYLDKTANEESGVLSVLRQNLGFLDNPRILNSLNEGVGDIARLLDDNVVVSFVLPPRDFIYYYRWARLVIGLSLFELLNERRQNVLLIIDEMTAVGELKILSQAYALMAGYGVRIWSLFQDLSQLRMRYPIDWESFVSNSGVVQCFSASDVFSAEYISQRIGNATKVVDIRSAGKFTQSAHSFPALTSDQIARMPAKNGILLLENNQPMLFKKIRHYEYFYEEQSTETSNQ